MLAETFDSKTRIERGVHEFGNVVRVDLDARVAVRRDLRASALQLAKRMELRNVEFAVRPQRARRFTKDRIEVAHVLEDQIADDEIGRRVAERPRRTKVVPHEPPARVRHAEACACEHLLAHVERDQRAAALDEPYRILSGAAAEFDDVAIHANEPALAQDGGVEVARAIGRRVVRCGPDAIRRFHVDHFEPFVPVGSARLLAHLRVRRRRPFGRLRTIDATAHPRITPFLWFDGHVEEAPTLYSSIFENATIHDVSRSQATGAVTSATFELDGQRFIAFDGGPYLAFSGAISFFITCEAQAEIDRYWERLSDGGEPQRCGWLRDRFGVTWQVVPAILGGLLAGEDDAGAARARSAMLAMDKLDIAALRAAYDGP
jgi:prepilin-type processing-associated H-X9-DG protein